MIWILLVVLTVLGGAAAIRIAVNERRKSLPGGGNQRALPPHVGDNLLERTVRDLRVNDVLTIDGRDFVCEGLISYDEDGHRWIGGRVVDASDARWLVVGLERTGAGATRLMTQDDSTPITGYPPEAIVVGEVRYAQDKRGTATCKLSGELAGLGGPPNAAGSDRVERCRWWLYTAPGDDTLLVEQWGGDYRVLRGKKINDGTIEMIPGS